MKIPRPLLAIKDFLICFLIGVIFLIAIFTVPLPVPIGAQNVGPFQFVAFPTGFAFYQNVSQSHFYSISPLDDFVIDQRGNKSTLATLSQLQSSKPKTNTTQLSTPKDVLVGIQNYIGHSSSTFSSPNGVFPATYSAQVNNNEVIITRKIDTKGVVIASTALTLKFSQDDFIFDKTGQIYNLKTPAEISAFNHFYNIDLLKPVSNDKTSLLQTDFAQLPSQITIANPNLNGLLVIQGSPSQILSINRLSNAIEILEMNPDLTKKSISSSLKIFIINKPGDATE